MFKIPTSVSMNQLNMQGIEKPKRRKLIMPRAFRHALTISGDLSCLPGMRSLRRICSGSRLGNINCSSRPSRPNNKRFRMSRSLVITPLGLWLGLRMRDSYWVAFPNRSLDHPLVLQRIRQGIPSQVLKKVPVVEGARVYRSQISESYTDHLKK